MKTRLWSLGMMVASVCVVADTAQAQSRYLLMEGSGEYGWNIKRPSKINGETEGRSLALGALSGHLEGMSNITKFEEFSKTEVKKTLKNKYEQIGLYFANTTTFTRDDKKENAFKGNKRGLVVSVWEDGFKPGTFQSSSDYNKLTQVRKSQASGILRYKFRIYAPEGYKPNGASQNTAEVKYTILNDTGRTVRFKMQPSGKSYTLENARTFSGHSQGTDGKAPTITLLDSGRTIPLTAGKHKLWWKKDAGRVALDLNYKM